MLVPLELLTEFGFISEDNGVSPRNKTFSVSESRKHHKELMELVCSCLIYI